MRRLASWTGWRRVWKMRAVQPSRIWLATRSTLSTPCRPSDLHDLRTYQDDDRRQIDPREETGGEREGPVRRERPDRAGESPERQLRRLPEHGRYQGGPAGRGSDDA